MILTNTVFVNLTATGGYSGQTESHTGFMPKEIFEKYEQEITDHTPYFHDIDGKHSEVEGKTITTHVSQDTLKGCLLAHFNADGNWQVYESLTDSVGMEEEEIQAIKDLSYRVSKGINVFTTVTVTLDGEEV